MSENDRAHAQSEAPENDERLTLTVGTLNKIFNTLGQMPYAQVAALITEIQQDIRPLMAEIKDTEDGVEATTQAH